MLTDRERSDAVNAFNQTERVRTLFTLEGFLEYSRAQKQKKMLEGFSLRSFQ